MQYLCRSVDCENMLALSTGQNHSHCHYGRRFLLYKYDHLPVYHPFSFSWIASMLNMNESVSRPIAPGNNRPWMRRVGWLMFSLIPGPVVFIVLAIKTNSLPLSSCVFLCVNLLCSIIGGRRLIDTFSIPTKSKKTAAMILAAVLLFLNIIFSFCLLVLLICACAPNGC